MACASLWEKVPAAEYKVKAISLTSQRGTVVNMDSCGQTLRPAITWMDQRKAKYKNLLEEFGVIFLV